MSKEGYKKFLEDMGHRVVCSSGVYWFNVHPHVYTCFPFNAVLNPKDIKLQEILGSDGWFVRYSCPIETGRPSFRVICDEKNYDLETLTGKARNQTRRGLENCEVRQLDFKEIAVHGMKLNRETMIRQGREIPPDFEASWKKYYQYAAKAEGAETWGAFCENNLAAYLIAFRIDGVSNILVVRSAIEYLKQYSNNALLYTYNKHILTETDMSEVSIGFESIQGDKETLDHFKKGLGFRQLEVGQRIEASNMIRLFMKGPVITSTLKFAEARSSNEKFRKMAGMLKWYMEQPNLK